MATPVVRFLPLHADPAGPAQWGVLFGEHIAPLDQPYATTGDLVRHGLAVARSRQPAQATIALADVSLLSPVTRNQQFICQGINYESHVRESGMDPTKIPFNTIFTKSPMCITGPYNDVVRPTHVRLLDYEIELGLVMKVDLTQPRRIGPEQLDEVLAGITIVNDVSARDVQLPQTQFYKGKSYRTFGPVGPYLLLLEAHEWRRLPALRMTLSVNGQIRQNDVCGAMIRAPHQTLSELSGLHDLAAGDLIATGTPAGCAAKAPGKLPMLVARHLLSEQAKWKFFINKGLRNPQYLQPDDVMELRIRTDDGRIDLGVQRNRVVAA
jgi:2-keto-4-pentenoate hydratase/2-oxohepta-3-ene-1,7-dioic acid hydratase in catechol pathway